MCSVSLKRNNLVSLEESRRSHDPWQYISLTLYYVFKGDNIIEEKKIGALEAQAHADVQFRSRRGRRRRLGNRIVGGLLQ